MTYRSFNLEKLADISPVSRQEYQPEHQYKPYKATNLVPEFLPVGHQKHQVRFNASTHDQQGILQHSTREALDNTIRLEEKIKKRMQEFQYFILDEQEDAETLVIAYGISASAARSATNKIREKQKKVSLLIPQTILPVQDIYLTKCLEYHKVIIVEESINNQFGRILFGQSIPDHVTCIGSMGKMITPEQIIEEAYL